MKTKIAIIAVVTTGLIVSAGIYFMSVRTKQPLVVTVESNLADVAMPVPPKTPEKKIYVRDDKLQAATDALLPFFDRMPQVPVYPNDEAIDKAGDDIESGVAYTICENGKPTIFVKKNFYRRTNTKQINNILKHELTHAWLCRKGIPWGHDENFKKKFKEVGGFGN